MPWRGEDDATKRAGADDGDGANGIGWGRVFGKFILFTALFIVINNAFLSDSYVEVRFAEEKIKLIYITASSFFSFAGLVAIASFVFFVIWCFVRRKRGKRLSTLINYAVNIAIGIQVVMLYGAWALINT